MCGLAGFLMDGAPLLRSDLAGMLDALAHRGPDAAGLWVEGPVGLGHRRLAILDTASHADQPMLDASGQLVIVFNGEIYNFQSLRDELTALGHGFRTSGDTEVILAAYRQWGTDCLRRFNGMFAFALWDGPQRQLFMARDRAGEKPLFYARTDRGLLFASEPRALRACPAFDATLDPSMLGRYLTLGYLTGENTLHGQMKRLPPGCFMLVQPGEEPLIQRYWSLRPAFSAPCPFRSEDEAAEAVLALLDDAVRLRMVADVPLGGFLSGGIDSASVVASMAAAGGAVRTFSVGFAEDEFSELDDARHSAAVLGVQHRDMVLDVQSDDMIRAIRHAADDPLADNSAVPTWFLCRFVRQHVTVALSGDAGDEIFAGYETYVADQLARPLAALPAGLWRGVDRLVTPMLPAKFSKIGWDEKARRFLHGLGQGWPRAHFAWRHLFTPQEWTALLRPDWQEQCLKVDPYLDFAHAHQQGQGLDPLDQSLWVDIVTWMVDDVLVKVDRMSMAHGLEVRAPFLDHRLMELAACLPSHWKLKGRRKKHILKHSQRHRLPPDIIDRRKRGFNAPMAHWLTGPLRDFAASALVDSSRLGDWVQPKMVQCLWNEHQSQKRDHSFKLYALLCLSLWMENQHP